MTRLFSPAMGVALALIGLSAWLLQQRENAAPLIPTDLPALERQLVEFLLFLPWAALVCCIIRNVIGLHTFGTFAPALLGLSFRDVHSPEGPFVLLIVLSIGWVLRRGIARLNLLQVPRAAVMLSMASLMLIGFIVIQHHRGRPVAGAIPFLPMVIVTGLIERFWSADEEDGTSTAVKIMANTMVAALIVFAVVQWKVVHRWAIERPESLGFVMAGQIIVGRYTGYRLVELRRFRALAEGER